MVELIQLHAEDVFVNPNAPIDFIKIARNHDSGRSAKQCRERWKNFLRSGIKKGAWTTDEEELIKDLYATFGAKYVSVKHIIFSYLHNHLIFLTVIPCKLVNPDGVQWQSYSKIAPIATLKINGTL